MKNSIAIGLAGVLSLGGVGISAAVAQGQETIVAIRHAEKPPGGLGQLTCRGLNRALALPKVLAHYGRPDAIFAPDPGDEVNDGGQVEYSYVRPLITIEPTAIALTMPVHAEIGFKNIARLKAEVTSPAFANGRIFVAWEHEKLNDFAQLMLRSYGENPSKVPDWPNDDYDRIYVFTITHAASGPKLAFRVDHEGLDGMLSDTCPGPEK